MATTMPFTKENAREAQAASVAAQRKRREEPGEVRAQRKIDESLERMAQNLIDAANGHGDFGPHYVDVEADGDTPARRKFVDGLKPEDRLSATLRALEWGIGKPTSTRPGMQPGTVKPEEPGLAIS